MCRGHAETPQIVEGGAVIETRGPPSGYLQQRQPGKALPLTQSLLLPRVPPCLAFCAACLQGYALAFLERAFPDIRLSGAASLHFPKGTLFPWGLFRIGSVRPGTCCCVWKTH